MNDRLVSPTKRLLDYLPAIYHDLDDAGKPGFLAQFLRAFERILFGYRESDGEPSSLNSLLDLGLEQEIVNIPSLFDPWETPEDFLPWLAGWAALSFHPELSVERRRKLLANIIPLYRIRGTRRYIEEVLTLCVDAFVVVTDHEVPAFQLQLHSTIGEDTYIGGGPPHRFMIRLIAPKFDEAQKALQASIAHAALSLAKPAHTFYELDSVSPYMQVGVNSSIGVDTVLSALQ
jgi:phage tail-like protein